MASGHVNRANRPNTWLHRPRLQREDSPCQLGGRGRDEDFSSPPHRSRRALLTHRAPTLDSDEKPLFWPRMQDAWERQVAVGDRSSFEST